MLIVDTQVEVNHTALLLEEPGQWDEVAAMPHTHLNKQSTMRIKYVCFPHFSGRHEDILTIDFYSQATIRRDDVKPS